MPETMSTPPDKTDVVVDQPYEVGDGSLEAKKVEEVVAATRSSARVLMKRRVEEEETKESEPDDTEPEEPPLKRQKRTWEQWSSEDKNCFFEALNECGKNFDAIQQFFLSKRIRKKAEPNTSAFKAKEQIRTFYYRTWHKISKHVTFPEGLKKSWCELYGLINFGELRRKTGSKLDEKYGLKLQQLVFEGHTTVRVKGKSHRLKTPMCPALIKINDKGAEVSASRATPLPDKITLVLDPANREAFVRVHGCAMQNPKLQLTVSPNTRLKSVFGLLNEKWSSTESKIINRFKDITSNKIISGKSQSSQLWLVPRSGTKLIVPILKPIEPVTSSSLSLSNLQSTKTEESGEDESPEPVHGIESEKDSTEDLLKGWTEENCNEMTIGKMFLINGLSNIKRGEIELLYSWKGGKDDKVDPQNDAVMKALSRIASVELNKKIGQKLTPLTTKLKVEPVKHEDEKEDVKFRRPAIPPVRLSAQNNQQQQAFRQQLDLLIPKYNQRKGRPLMRSKNVVSRQIVSNRPLRPKVPPLVKTVDGKVKIRCFVGDSPAPAITLTHPVISLGVTKPVATITDAVNETSLPVVEEKPQEKTFNGEESNDGFGTSCLDLLDDNSRQSKIVGNDEPLFDMEQSNSSLLQTPPVHRPTPPTSPFCDDPSWMPEISLNSLLGNLSTSKVNPHMINEDSTHSTGSEVDRQLISMMNESSVDFTSKFAKLTSAMNDND